MRIKRYNVHKMGNGILVEFQGDEEIGEKILSAFERIIAENIIRKVIPEISKEALLDSLERNKWNGAAAAIEFSVHKQVIYRRMRKFGLKRPRKVTAGEHEVQVAVGES